MSRAPVDIEALLVWAYRDQKVERADAGGTVYDAVLGGHTGGGDVRGAIDALRYGCMIGGGGGMAMSLAASAAVHDDALVVHGAVRTLRRRVVELVRQHARLGTRPDCMARARPHLAAVLDDRDEPKVSSGWTAARRRIPQYCPVRLVDHPDSINRARRTYAAWHEALSVLAGHFVSHPASLTRWRVAGFAAPARPAEPWAVPPIDPRHTVPDEALPDVIAFRSAASPTVRKGKL